MTSNPVQDLPAPRSLVLRMDITNSCNLDCVGCTLADNRKIFNEPAGSMDVDLFQKITREVFPYLKEVALSCEAEPTMHPRFIQIMKIIGATTERNAVLPVRMTTNATLFTREKLDAVFDSGLFGLSISIDGDTAQTFAALRKNGDIVNVFESIDEILRRKAALGRGALDSPRLQINYTLMKSNIHELIPLIERARTWQLESLTVTHVYSIGTKDMRHEFLADTPDESDRVLIEAEKLCREYGIIARFPILFNRGVQPPAPATTVKNGFWSGLVSRFRRPEPELACAAPWNMLKIRWNGEVQPCDLWYTLGPFGSLKSQSFEEIWRSEKYTELRYGLFSGNPTFEHCRKCDQISQDNLEKRTLKSAMTHTSVPGGQ